jgi:hypothetical protein
MIHSATSHKDWGCFPTTVNTKIGAGQGALVWPAATNAPARQTAHTLGYDGADTPPESLLERSCEGGLASTSRSVERSSASSSTDHAAWQTQYCKFSDAEYTRLAVAFGMISKLAPNSPQRQQPNPGGVRFSPKAARPGSARPLSSLQWQDATG